MVRIITCACCRREVRANPRSKDQRYCGRPECQKERKRKWQQVKIATDPDYRANQREAQKSWRERNSDYWRKRKKGQTPPSKRDLPAGTTAVKMDVSAPFLFADSMEYIIYPTQGKMDALRAKIIAVTG